jgi:hypothetical protein
VKDVEGRRWKGQATTVIRGFKKRRQVPSFCRVTGLSFAPQTDSSLSNLSGSATPIVIEVDFWFRLDVTFVELLYIVFGDQHAGSVELAGLFGFFWEGKEEGETTFSYLERAITRRS